VGALQQRKWNIAKGFGSRALVKIAPHDRGASARAAATWRAANLERCTAARDTFKTS
jgi:hypothetical protein